MPGRVTEVHDNANELPIPIKRALRLAFRNAMAAPVIKRMYGIISAWFPDLKPAQLADHFEQERGNFAKQCSEGTLALRLLVEILVRSGKDFSDLVLGAGEKLLSPQRVAELKLLGTRAALLEYRARDGDRQAVQLSIFDTIILKTLHQAKKLDCESWDWIYTASQQKRPESPGALVVSALVNLGKSKQTAQIEHLERLRTEWRLAVPPVLGLLFDFQ